MLARIRKSIEDKDAGFTLVELLVVMIIIGILAAIAIPVFLNQRTKANDTSIKSDLRTVAQEMETRFVDTQTYTTAANTNAKTEFANNNYGTSNTLTIVKADSTGYCLQGSATASNATSGKFFWVDSKLGGLQPGAATATKPAGACA